MTDHPPYPLPISTGKSHHQMPSIIHKNFPKTKFEIYTPFDFGKIHTGVRNRSQRVRGVIFVTPLPISSRLDDDTKVTIIP